MRDEEKYVLCSDVCFPRTSYIAFTFDDDNLRILGEFILISSLPGKALRTHVDIARLCQAIQHACSKPSLVILISKVANLVFYLSVYP